MDNRAEPKAIKAEQQANESTLYLYDVIDDYWGISAQAFATALAAIPAENTVHLRINSPGGDVFAARAMVAALKGFKGKTVAHIDGVCASAATYVALACGEVEMIEGAFFMIHNAWTYGFGNAEELRKTADLLEKVDEAIVVDYEKKTGAKRDQIQQWMAAETWFSAQEALDAKFVDRVVDGSVADAAWNLGAYDKAPQALKDRKPPRDLDAEAAALRAAAVRRWNTYEQPPGCAPIQP